MSLGKTIKLSTGADMPMLGFGTWNLGKNPADAVAHAIRTGYHHIDTAFIYGNEKEVGEGIRNSGVPREELFVNCKLWNTYHDPKDISKGIDTSLMNLGLDYLDLYLMHWPCSFKSENGDLFPKQEDGNMVDAKIDYVDTWRAMINEVQKKGKAKAIGVSNFNIPKLNRLIQETGVKPAVNQVELHPYQPQWKLINYCREQGIAVTAYSPLGGSEKSNLREDGIIREIADEKHVQPAQILLAWGVHRGTAVIPKSSNLDRIDSNYQQVELTSEDMARINSIEHRERVVKGTQFGSAYNWIFDKDEN